VQSADPANTPDSTSDLKNDAKSRRGNIRER
jgi:hypothetical protein